MAAHAPRLIPPGCLVCPPSASQVNAILGGAINTPFLNQVGHCLGWDQFTTRTRLNFKSAKRCLSIQLLFGTPSRLCPRPHPAPLLPQVLNTPQKVDYILKRIPAGKRELDSEGRSPVSGHAATGKTPGVAGSWIRSARLGSLRGMRSLGQRVLWRASSQTRQVRAQTCAACRLEL